MATSTYLELPKRKALHKYLLSLFVIWYTAIYYYIFVAVLTLITARITCTSGRFVRSYASLFVLVIRIINKWVSEQSSVPRVNLLHLGIFITTSIFFNMFYFRISKSPKEMFLQYYIYSDAFIEGLFCDDTNRFFVHDPWSTLLHWSIRFRITRTFWINASICINL